MTEIEYTNNCAKVKAALSDGVRAFLYEAGGELQNQTMRNSRVDTGQTRGSYQYRVEEGSQESTVHVGSDLENAIWEEFGTGEYALHGDGRKGGWIYKSPKNGEFYRTKGKTPNRPLYQAFHTLREKLKRRLAEVLQSKLG